MQRGRVAPVQRRVDDRRHRHAPDRGEAGQDHVGGILELALQHLALQLEPHEEEEHRHQAVIDPVQHVLGDALAVDGHGHRNMEKRLIGVGETGIVDHQGRHGGQHQEYAA